MFTGQTTFITTGPVVGALWLRQVSLHRPLRPKVPAAPLEERGPGVGPPVGFRLQQGAGGEWTVPPARPQEEILSIKLLLTNRS